MLTIVYFAWVRELIGLDEEQVARPDLLARVVEAHHRAGRLAKGGGGRVNNRVGN